MGVFVTGERSFGWLLRAVPILCLAALLVILSGNVVARYTQLWSIAWFDEIVEGLFAWMVFIGAAAHWREGEHFQVDWAFWFMPTERARAALHAFVWTASLAFIVTMTWYGWRLTAGNAALTPILKLPVAWLYAPIPLSGAIMTAYSLVFLARSLFRLVRPSRPANQNT